MQVMQNGQPRRYTALRRTFDFWVKIAVRYSFSTFFAHQNDPKQCRALGKLLPLVLCSP